MIQTDIKIEVKLDKLSTAGPAVHAALAALVTKACLDIEAAAKDSAAVDTGAMRASVYSVVDGKDDSAQAQVDAEALNPKMTFLPRPDGQVDELHGMVTVGAEYAAYVEYGTVRQAAQPFFEPAVESVRPSFEAAVKRVGDAI